MALVKLIVKSPVAALVTLLTLNEDRMDWVLPLKFTHAFTNCPATEEAKEQAIFDVQFRSMTEELDL